MCEFTVYFDGHEDSNIVATSVIKTAVKPGYIVLMDTAGRITKVPNAKITKVDTIMTELILDRCEA
jgi:predicted RNA-binding protein